MKNSIVPSQPSKPTVVIKYKKLYYLGSTFAYLAIIPFLYQTYAFFKHDGSYNKPILICSFIAFVLGLVLVNYSRKISDEYKHDPPTILR